MAMAYRILSGRPRSAAPSAPSDTVLHREGLTAAKAETLRRSADPAHDDDDDDDDNSNPPRSLRPLPSHDPPAWWEKKQDGIGISSSFWRRRLVDTLWSAGPLCCWASLVAFIVLNLAVLVCEGPRYLCSGGLLFVALAIPFPVLGIRWWRKSSCET